MIAHESGEWRTVPLTLWWEVGIAEDKLDIKQSLTIGRRSSCDISLLGDGKVSRTHCVVAAFEEGWFVVDLESTGGTTVLGCETDWGPLVPGAQIRVGDTILNVIERVELRLAA